MSKAIAMLVAGYMLLAFSVPAANAISSVKAKAKGGSAKVSGKGAVPGADIEWEGVMFGVVGPDGKFKFTAPLPSDCIGELSDGVMTLFVPVNKCIPSQEPVGAPVVKTGQTTIHSSGDDGDFQAGVPLPEPRFTDNLNGTVTDNLTGLIWFQDARCSGEKNWAAALSFANNLAHGQCGLMDGSIVGDWRLPNLKELQSLMHYGFGSPALSDAEGTGNWTTTSNGTFTNVLSTIYWSSTTQETSPSQAWYVNFSRGNVDINGKSASRRVLPVRGP